MTERIGQIAERIKELREISSISPETLAKEINISKDLYLQYESGSVDMPVGFLLELAHKYNIELSAILSGDNPHLHMYCIVRKGDGLKVDRRKQYTYENLAGHFIGKKAEPFMVTVDPAPENTPIEFNSHPGQEFNCVVQGTLKIIIEGHDIILNEGDSLYFNSGYNHAMQALQNKQAKFLAIIL